MPSYHSPKKETAATEDATTVAPVTGVADIVDEVIQWHKDIFAIDIGYGDVKVKTSSMEFIFNSLVSPALKTSTPPTGIEDFAATPAEVLKHLAIEYNGKLFNVGRLAAASDPRVERKTFGDRIIDTNLIVLYRAALVAAYAQHSMVELYIVSGLPNEYYSIQQEDLKRILQDVDTITYYLGGVKRILKVKVPAVHINTQPEGFYVDLMLDGDLKPTEEWRPGRVFATADLGHFTLDYTLFRGREAVGLNQGYTGSSRGVSEIYEAVADALRRKYKLSPTHQQVESVIRTGFFQYRVDDVQDVKDLIGAICRKYAEEVFDVLYNAWEDVLPEIDAILIEGGGASLVSEQLYDLFVERAKFRHVYLAEDPQLRNVRGYYKLGKHIFSKEVDKR